MTLTLALLSWKSHETLLNTLDSYRYYGLDKLADQKIIFFQEVGDTDLRIADIYGYDTIGSPNNIGIGAAYKRLVEESASDLFLFLENDWALIEHPVSQILGATAVINWNLVDVVKLRHRTSPGTPLWSRQYAGNERSAPQYLLDAVHWRDDNRMRELQPEIEKHGLWHITTSRYANWTNNPTLAKTDFLRENIVPRLEGDIEKALQPWWQEQYFRVAQGTGLFTHLRIDR